MKTIIASLFTMLLFSGMLKAQDNFAGLFKSTPADVSKLAMAYINPSLKGFSHSLNSGWVECDYDSIHVSLAINFMASIIPDVDKSFDITSLGLSNAIKPTNPTQTLSPTYAGFGSIGPQVTITDPSQPNNKYTTNLSAGTYAIDPALGLQFSIGNRDVTLSLRLIPKINQGTNQQQQDIGIVGIGLKYNFAKLLGRNGKL